MSFKAEHSIIRGFGNSLNTLTDDADNAHYYVQKWLDLGYDEGRMFATVVEKCTDVREALLDNYKKLGQVTMGSATELVNAADYYRDTDQDAAARTDATY